MSKWQNNNVTFVCVYSFGSWFLLAALQCSGFGEKEPGGWAAGLWLWTRTGSEPTWFSWQHCGDWKPFRTQHPRIQNVENKLWGTWLAFWVVETHKPFHSLYWIYFIFWQTYKYKHKIYIFKSILSKEASNPNYSIDREKICYSGLPLTLIFENVVWTSVESVREVGHLGAEKSKVKDFVAYNRYCIPIVFSVKMQSKCSNLQKLTELCC